jgi:hypothetical protein
VFECSHDGKTHQNNPNGIKIPPAITGYSSRSGLIRCLLRSVPTFIVGESTSYVKRFAKNAKRLPINMDR